MIVLDTHIWRWWADMDYEKLTKKQLDCLSLYEKEKGGLGVSIISCWEIAKKTEVGKLSLGIPVRDWILNALSFSSVMLLDLTLDIVLDSTNLPGDFHRDPMDQIIVATARVYDHMLLTSDSKILNYEHVKTLELN